MATTDPVFTDAETIPTQARRHIERIKAGIEAELSVKVHELRSAEIKAPKNYTKQETIDAYIAEKRAGLEEAVQAEIAKATEEFDKAWRKTALSGAFGELVVVSMAFGDDWPVALFEESWQAPDREIKLLRSINETLEQRLGRHRGQMLVGHNIPFDRNFIRQRGIIHGVRMHELFTRPVKPWDNDLVFDTMTAWTGDARSTISLDNLCEALGVEQVKGTELDEHIDGSMVWDFVQAGKIAKVARYCQFDVIRARACYHLMNYRNPPELIEPGSQE